MTQTEPYALLRKARIVIVRNTETVCTRYYDINHDRMKYIILNKRITILSISCNFQSRYINGIISYVFIHHLYNCGYIHEIMT